MRPSRTAMHPGTERSQRWLLRTSAIAAGILLPCLVFATYSGGGVAAGVAQAGSTGVGGSDLKVVIGNIVDAVLDFVTLFAVVAIIIAGFYLILGLGNDSSKETAKKIIIYVGAGLIVILLSKAFVNWIKSLA